MTQHIDIIKQYNQSFEEKNAQKMRALIHPNYHFKGPMMEMQGIESFMEFMKNFPFQFSNRNIRFIAEKNAVVQIFDCDISSPFKANIPMCEYFEIENGKIKSAQIYFDSAAFPKEAQAAMQEKMPTN